MAHLSIKRIATVMAAAFAVGAAIIATSVTAFAASAALVEWNGTAVEDFAGAVTDVYYDSDVCTSAADPTAYTNTMDELTESTSVSQFIVYTIGDQKYTGSPITPSVRVAYNGMMLTEGTHYTVAYSNNIEPGTATVTITGIGYYTGTKTVNFAIKKDIANATVSAVADQIYTAFAIKPELTVMDGDKALVLDTDYYVDFSDNKNVGTASVTIQGIRSYMGTKTITFNILQRSLNDASIDPISDKTYTGYALTHNLHVVSRVLLTKDTDYTVTYSDNVNVGTATVTITGIGNYKDSKSITFNIVPKSIGICYSVIDAIEDQPYTGSEITPTVSVRVGTTTLVNGTDYTVAYSNNIDIGTATVTVTGIGNYEDYNSAKFQIVARPVSDLTVSAIADQTYTGSAITPTVTVKNGSTTLTNDTHYTVAYSNNTNVGTATVTITGKGNYTGTKTATFKIVAKSISGATVSAIEDQTYTGSAITPAVTVKDGSKTLVNGTDYTVAYSNNTNAGTATVTITGKGNYTGTKTTTFNIVAAVVPPANVKATAGEGKITLTWNAVTDATKYKVRRHDGIAWADYKTVATTSLTDNDVVNGTTYKYAVYAYVNNKWSASSTIVSATPIGSTIAENVKATAGDGKVTITWDAVAGATKYKVRRHNGTAWADYKTVTATILTDTDVVNGTTYKYAVYAYVGNKFGGASAIVSAKPAAAAPAAPTNVKATSGTGKITLTWNAVNGATKYKVRRHNGTSWADYKIVTETTLTDTDVTVGTTYKYAVYAYGSKWSAASASVAASPLAAAPTNLKATASDGKITLTWDAVDGATKYKVRRHNGTSWSDYKTVTDTTLVDTAVTNGTTYKYAVYAYAGGKWSGASEIVSAAPKASTSVQNVNIVSSNGVIMLTWDKVSGAEKYRIRRHDGTKWSDYKDLTENAYADVTVIAGTKYKYAVYVCINGVWGGASAIVSATA